MSEAGLSAAAWCRRIGRSHALNPALIDGARQRTYAELDARTDRLARALIAAGVGPGDRVAALLYNGAPLIELYFAAAKARAILLPLNWRLAAPEIAFIVEDATPKLLFVSPGLAPLADGLVSHARRIAVPDEPATDDPFEALVAGDLDSLPGAEPDDLWIMLYTSGTTGRPKGCLLDQRGQFVSALASALLWRAQPHDKVLMALPLFHVGGLGILFAHMIVGACTVIAPRVCDGALARDMIADYGCTRAAIAPQLYARMLEVQAEVPRPLALDLVSMGGGMHEPALVAEVRDALETDILLGYGQTEAGNFISYLTAAEQLARPRSCGRAMAHLDVAVLDEAGRPVPAGASGELVVRGASVLRRYWNQPEATGRTLRDGWLRTGDLFSIDEAGYLTLLGRLKDLIKSGGENVYPKEVEAVLDAHPAITESCVFGVPDDQWGEAVKAVIVIRPGRTLTAGEIVAWCRDHIAGYKRPRYIEFVDALPRSDAGKLLMRDLRARPTGPEHWTG
ncbi:class I adenylate-forming enzyme family protein [Sphingomonas profundi]|uniref:class I adenylate-forming enzyme family protein n=1 Tax=Alterirhizorhabdus profundi TaxID=2681549 RepID=UPI0018D13DEE|nr:AMP-binding protein [Sphingomonas profundi]